MKKYIVVVAYGQDLFREACGELNLGCGDCLLAISAQDIKWLVPSETVIYHHSSASRLPKLAAIEAIEASFSFEVINMEELETKNKLFL